MKTKKIIKAVKCIEDYCRKTIDCTYCVLGKNTMLCPLGHSPKKWDTKTIKANLKDIERI